MRLLCLGKIISPKDYIERKKQERKKTFIQQNTVNTTQEQFINNHICVILYQATNELLQSISLTH